METCLVSGIVLSPEGVPLPGATVEFKMTRLDRDGGTIVLPHPVVVEVGAGGYMEVRLWPNVRGYAGTAYTVTIRVQTGSRAVLYGNFRVVVPDSTTASLVDISEMLPPAPVDEGRQQVILAREARDEARVFRDEAMAARDEAEALLSQGPPGRENPPCNPDNLNNVIFNGGFF